MLTLGILALVTLLLVAFVTSMRVENMASKNFNDLIKARQLAQAAVDYAVDKIRVATPIRVHGPPVFTWVTYPGFVAINSGGVFNFTNLYSYVATTPTLNINDKFWITSQNNLDFPPALNNSQINVNWIYVAEDETVTPPGMLLAPPNPYPISPATPQRQIIGRFAFWVDDEASKININQAWQRPNGSDSFAYNDAFGDTSEVDLNALLANLNTYVAAIYAPPSPGKPFATIEEVRRANAAITPTDFDVNRFYLTTASDDVSDLDVFGRPRTDISSLTMAAGTPLLSDPALDQVYSSSGNFAGKYTPNGLNQVIANIIAYQHNPTNAADPLAFPPDAGGNPPAYLGLTRAPYVNEVQVRYDDLGNGNVRRTIAVELYYPYAADGQYLSGLAGSEDQIVISGIPNPTIAGATFATAFPNPATITINVVAGTTFNAGAPYYVTATVPPVGSLGYQDQATLTLPPPPPPGWPAGPVITIPAGTVTVNYQRADASGVYHRLDCAQAPLPTTTLTIPWAPPVPPGWTPALPVWQGAEVNDPCLNEITANWTGYTESAPPPGNGTLGSQNLAYFPVGGDVSKVRIRAAPMKSVGELGFIHTPTSWKYLKLQPSGGAALGQIPDWAMLDLFRVNPAPPTMGRININSFVNPGFPNGGRRSVPLNALLYNLGLPLTAAQNIYDDLDPSVRTDLYGMPFGSSATKSPVFDTIGEICEIPALANGATTEAGKEAVIRRIANLLTVRSNTFTIWAIAQSIKEPPNPSQIYGTFQDGIDIITGEVKVQAIVQRYEDPPPPATPITVKFRTLYFRYYYQ